MTRSMNHSAINDFVAALKMHPIVGFIFCIFGAIFTASGPVSSHWELPVIVMQLGQWLAWIFVYTTGIITFLGALEKYCDIKIRFNFKFLKKRKKNDN